MKKIYYVKGMHCTSCEIILEKELNALKGIEVVRISHKTCIVELKVQDNFDEQEVKSVIERNNFTICETLDDAKAVCKAKKNSIIDYVEMIAIIVVLGDIVLMMRNVEFSRFFPNIGGQVGVLVALLFGLIASLSTCLIMVGGIVMSFGSIYPTEENKDHPFLQRAQPHIFFHVGRIFGFAALGGILGLIGQKISYSVTFTGYLTMIVSLIMIYMALYILNIVPSITKLGFHLPKGLSKNIHTLSDSDHHLVPIIIGVLTFFLPCGFTQSMQLAAVASGSFLTGFLIMGAFALGTFPVLLSVGMGASFAKDSGFGTLKRIAGVLIIFFALYSINSGMVLAGYNSPFDYFTKKPFENDFMSKESVKATGEKLEASVNADKKAKYQIINMDVDWTFKPRHFVMKKGVPVRWEIQGINITGCSNEVVIPRLNISKKISKGLNVVEFTPRESGNLPFSCWMGMINGNFKVVDTLEELEAWKANGYDNVNVSNVVYEEVKNKAKNIVTVQQAAEVKSKNDLNNVAKSANIYVPPEGALPSGSCGGACGGSSCGAKSGGACGCGGRAK